MVIQIIFLIFLLGALFWFVSLLIAAYSGAPTVYSRDKVIKKALNLANLKPDQTILDLGCGNGRVLIIASRKFQAKGIGIEISPFYYLLARLNVLIRGESRNIKIYFGNIKKHHELVNDADVIYLYLYDKLLENIEPILFKNLAKNAKVISVAFPFKNHQAKAFDGPPKIYIYEK